MTDSLVLVTGGSGFIAGHVILKLVEHGHRVRTTVRSLERAAAVREVLDGAGLPADASLEFVEADLTADDGWAAAVAGVDAVLHVASPVHLGPVDDEDDVIRPAREGTLRVLRAARDAGVRRVVLTSAFHAVGFGQPHDHGEFTEEDWTPLDGPGVDAYGRSKVLAERAAWDLIRAEGRGTELVTLLPVAVMGPVMGPAVSGSNHLVEQMLSGRMRGLPNVFIPIVDVRDVAEAHAAAVVADGAAGERILLASGEPAVAMADIAATLRDALGAAADRVPTQRIPDDVVRAGAERDPGLRPAAADLGFVKRVSIEKARRLLGFAPRPSAEAIVAAGASMVARGLDR